MILINHKLKCKIINNDIYDLREKNILEQICFPLHIYFNESNKTNIQCINVLLVCFPHATIRHYYGSLAVIVSVMIVSELLLSVSGQVTPRHLNPPRGAVTGYSLFMIGSNYSLFIILVARFTVYSSSSPLKREIMKMKREYQ